MATSFFSRQPLRMVPSSRAGSDVHAPERLSSLSLDGTRGRNRGIDSPAVRVLLRPVMVSLLLLPGTHRRWKSLPMCRTVRSLLHLFLGGEGGDCGRELVRNLFNVKTLVLNTCMVFCFGEAEAASAATMAWDFASLVVPLLYLGGLYSCVGTTGAIIVLLVFCGDPLLLRSIT